MIDDTTLDSILFLSRLTVSSEEKEQFRRQVGSILEYFDLLKEYDTEGVDPDLGNSIEFGDLRQDTPAQEAPPEAIASLFNHLKDSYFPVPRILDDFLENREEE